MITSQEDSIQISFEKSRACGSTSAALNSTELQAHPASHLRMQTTTETEQEEANAVTQVCITKLIVHTLVRMNSFFKQKCENYQMFNNMNASTQSHIYTRPPEMSQNKNSQNQIAQLERIHTENLKRSIFFKYLLPRLCAIQN